MRIVAFEVEDWEREGFGALQREHDVRFVVEPLSVRCVALYAEAEVICTFIYSDLSAVVLQRLPHLRLVSTRSTGVDHIAIAYCAAHGIPVVNVPSYGSNTVAEHTFALLLCISHRMIESVERARRGEPAPEARESFDLWGKTLGVVGTGSIGRWVVRIARGFGMQVLAFDGKPDDRFAREMGFPYVGLDELLTRADVVTLHLPLTAETHHLIGREALAKMKESAVLINTARGGLVDAEALAEALLQRRLRAAGLDVLSEEPAIREEAELLRRAFRERHALGTLLADHVLLRSNHVVVTPHSAFRTREAVQRIVDTTADNIAAFARGTPQNLVAGTGEQAS